uniref:Uncharacterized protein n=1 Tax=Rhizophora mucronata TaxID=61149 RepID=A0A2P2JEF9_RHIMU
MDLMVPYIGHIREREVLWDQHDLLWLMFAAALHKLYHEVLEGQSCKKKQEVDGLIVLVAKAQDCKIL